MHCLRKPKQDPSFLIELILGIVPPRLLRTTHRSIYDVEVQHGRTSMFCGFGRETCCVEWHLTRSVLVSTSYVIHTADNCSQPDMNRGPKSCVAVVKLHQPKPSAIKPFPALAGSIATRCLEADWCPVGSCRRRSQKGEDNRHRATSLQRPPSSVIHLFAFFLEPNEPSASWAPPGPQVPP